VYVVWLKRDLRIRDHRPLVESTEQALAEGHAVLVLYVYEPELLARPEHDPSHLRFVNQSLAELDAALAMRGGTLAYRVGRMPDVLEELHRTAPITQLWSHRETGNQQTYARDVRVADWCRARGVPWREIPQDGVIRRLRDRDGWAARWNARMREPIVEPPARIPGVRQVDRQGRREPAELGLEPSHKETQLGGESRAHDLLESFLHRRGLDYRTDMSTPVRGWDGCSRLSPHLAFGTISMRQVHQATQARVAALPKGRAGRTKADIQETARWRKSLVSFGARLRWHCHFMQKLEDEPRIEHEHMNLGFTGMRDEVRIDRDRFDAWAEGRTGYPLVDACMRCLLATGWVNFRMRAMLVSFASYHLWLHWREPAIHLARHFLDFEPGIHFSQVQMQSGTTGINTVRIYSPIKQAREQDPEGTFIRRWVPELEGVPVEHLAEPHRMSGDAQRSAGCVIGRDYSAPIVDHAKAYAFARRTAYAWRARADVREESRVVLARHGSRKRPRGR
jgi:deoxyribodipyrimidine photo-lyase